MNEEWKSCSDPMGYEVSNLGRIRTASTGHIRRTPVTCKGHPKLVVYRDGKHYSYSVSRLVATAFIGKPPQPSYRAVHIDGDTTNNRVDNLTWKRAAETNEGSAIKRKLTLEQATRIREKYAQGADQCSLAKLFGVHQSTISNIVTNRSWTEYFDGPVVVDPPRRRLERRPRRPAVHGTVGMYNNHSCRCLRCVEAKQASNRNYRPRGARSA